jgi:hypothetical protein
MGVRYQHLTTEVRRDIAKQVGGLIWQAATAAPAEPQPAKPNGGDDGTAGGLALVS